MANVNANVITGDKTIKITTSSKDTIYTYTSDEAAIVTFNYAPYTAQQALIQILQQRAIMIL